MPPTLHPIADRSYELLSDIYAAKAAFDVLFTYAGTGKPDSLWLHRWFHYGPQGKTVIVLFKPHDGQRPRISLLGPRVEAVDELVVER